MNNPTRILIVEDDPLIRDAIQEILPDTEYQVETAEHGKDALRLIKLKKYDLIITDVIMEEMDGIELIREIRKNNITIPVVGMSGHPTGSKFLPSMRLLGVTTTLLKPFSKDALMAAISYSLSSKEP